MRPAKWTRVVLARILPSRARAREREREREGRWVFTFGGEISGISRRREAESPEIRVIVIPDNVGLLLRLYETAN
jgi:hypothetical protein